MNGKILIKKPKICGCNIRINGSIKQLGPFSTKEELALPFGAHRINVAIIYYDTSYIGAGHGKRTASYLEWAWENDREIVIDETVTKIKIKRKWHLLRHVTTEVEITK